MLYTPAHKHQILTHYCAGVRGAGFHALARRFAVRGGARLIQQWHARWDGTPQSLQRKAGSSRPRALSRLQVQQHVQRPIRAANRAQRAIHYSSLAQHVRAATGANVSDRTVRRYGKAELGAKGTRGKKRTAGECEYIHPHATLRV